MDDELSAFEGEEEQEIEPELLPEEEHVEEESILTEYDPDEFLSGAVNTLDSTLPLDLFEFEHSYGYNCQKYFNLCACDETVVCWASGSIITFMDVNTKQTWFRRSTTGGSVGHITSYRQDPNYRIAIAEGREGFRDPVIILYTWPQMEMDAVLRDGTTNAYSILDFSPDGELLASVGKEPDYNLTIWTWKRHKILLRTSAFTFDVNTVMFSPYCPGQLTTAGAAHIKFWKMAQTFTGLKLKGELGRFGKTEICDVLGVYPMPDEKVLTGCEWGNVLVWEAGLVKIEVTQRGRKTCHKAPVIQFMLSEAGDEVTTIARDGCIRAWYWDTVEQADPPEDDPYVELNPVAETCIPGCQIMCLKHQKDLYWYAQDGNGGLWCADIEIDKLECAHRKVFTCHSGGVVSMAMLRTHPILVTAGQDGALHAYSTETHVLLARYVFPTAVSCMLYPPIDVDQTSRIIMVGFGDGIMRTLLLHPERLQKEGSLIDIRVHSALTIHSDDSEHPDVIDMISLLKPHSKSLTQITINEQRTLLVTCGQDCTIFMYKLILGTPFTLERLGFIDTPNNIAFMTWKPEEEHVLLLCGRVGFVMEAVLPEVDVRDYSEITTFKLDFVSFKEVLVRKHFMRNRPFPTEEDLASIDEEALKAKDDAGKDDDEEEEYLGEIQLMESESMLGTTITWAEYCEQGIWVVQQGTGALLLVKPGFTKILKYGPFPGAWTDDITVLKFICEGRYLAIGTNTGYVRVVRMPTEEEDSDEHHYVTWMNATQKLLKKLKGRRLAKEEKQPIPRIDFLDNYYLPMHDRYTGAVTCLEFSSDGKRLFTSGADGNIFSYLINFPEPLIETAKLPRPPELPRLEKVKEPSTVDDELMSHEQLKQKEEYDKMMAIANAHKKRVRDQLSELTFEYSKLIKANKYLPVSQQIDVTLDPRPLVVQENELDEAKALTIRKLAHQLEASDLALHKMYSRNIIQLDVFPFILKAIRDPEVIIRPLRQKNLSKDFVDQLEEVHQKMAEAALRGRRAESTTRRAAVRKQSWGPPKVASFLLGLPPRPPHPLKKALRNYYQRLNRHHLQFIEWQEHLARKPDPAAMPPGAAEALKEAEASIGNRVLKTHPDYVAPPGHNTQLRVCAIRKEIYDNKRVFNEKVLQLRDHKVHLVTQMKQIGERLAEIRGEIPAKMVRPPPAVPTIDDELEFPEKNLEIKPEIKPATGRQAMSSKKMADRRETSTATYPQPRVRQPRVTRFVPLSETRPLAASWVLLKATPDLESTPEEIEIRERRIERHLYEQDMLLADAETAVQQFDARLRQLQRERIRVQENNQLLELKLCQLHREMNVLNRFEAHEDRLAERVYAKLMQVRGVQDQIVDCEHRIEEHYVEKETLNEHCEELQRAFKKLVQDNKFADFLRRIFKKKYRPPRDRDSDGATLLWPETYHFRAVLKIPSANITEPYEVWADGETENYRFDYYNGMTKIFRKQSVNNGTTYYAINPESTGAYLNKEVCHELQVDSRLVRSLLSKTYLPLNGRLSFEGKESLNNIKTNKWVYRAKSVEYDVTVDHRVWTLTKSIINGNSKVWIPIRHEYRLLQGDRELDFMQHDYANFTIDKPDSTVFNLPADLKCPLYASELRYEAVDPILELVNPDLEHARTSKAFETYKLEHNKEYKTKDEHFMRLQVFKNNLRYIQSMNRQQNSYKLAVNHLADATEDELSVFLGTEISPELYDSDSEFVDDEINAKGYLDWRITGAVTPVKDQTTLCGSCYAFAVAAAIESAVYIRNGFQHLEELSEQAIIDCTWGGSFANHGCDGGKPDYSLNWIRDYGIFYKKDYGPYLAMAGYCDKDQPRLLTISGFNQAPRNVSIIKRMLRRKGPMIAAISLTRSLHFYSSGIYNDSDCSSNPDKRLHSVVIVGYGKENDQKYWIVKNTYGKQWGEKGYLRLDMKDNVCESSEESESSSSSEEDEGASVDSRDIGPIRLDPNICPEGCEPDVFNKTYDLRNTRHKHEQDMIEQDRLVDLLRKDIEAHNKVKRKLAVQLDKRKNELREFMLEKQSCMNEVDQVIILRYDQIRASTFRGCTGPDGLSKTVVFPEALLKRLRKRVLELQDEIKQQKQRQKVNRTHLFRMNVDLRAMEAQAEELRAQMRDVLTRKLGKPRRVDKTLDDLLRQMARRHKFSTTLGTIPQVMKQIRGWRDRYSELEQKYLAVLNRHSERLRTAAALQADVLPQKPLKSVEDMAGTYDAEVFLRDVVRLRIVRSQQMNQMKALREEIKLLRLKPLSPRPPLPSAEPPWEQRDDIYLFMGPRSTWRPRKKYFPITPLGSQVKLVYDVNIMKLLYDCLDAMRVTRDDAEELLQELTALLPDVLSGAKSRYEVVDMLVKKWLLKYGGDPSQYKKQTRAFDALAALADRLIREHMETLEGTGSHEVMQQLEGALKAVAGSKEPLNARLGPALAALFHTAQTADLESIETMASLVKSLVDDDHPLTAESLERIDIFDVIGDIRECGVTASQEDIGEIVVAAIECLRAQLPTTEETRQMEDEVEKALATERKSRSAAFSKASSRVVSIAPSAHSTDQSAKRSASTSRSVRSSFRADTAELGRARSTTDTGRTSSGGRSTHSSDTGDKTDADTDE